MKFSGKICFKIILKGLHHLYRRHIFQKPQAGGVGGGGGGGRVHNTSRLTIAAQALATFAMKKGIGSLQIK